MIIKSTTKENESTFDKPLIAEGLYDAALKEVKPISDGEFGSRAVFLYTIESEDVNLPFVVYTANPANKNNKLGQTILAHGVELNDGDLDLDSLKGTKVKVLVEDYSYKDGGEDKKASSITKVKPFTEETSEDK